MADDSAVHTTHPETGEITNIGNAGLVIVHGGGTVRIMPGEKFQPAAGTTPAMVTRLTPKKE